MEAKLRLKLFHNSYLIYSKRVDSLSDDDREKAGKIAKFLAECASTQAQVTWAMENTEWDFTAVYFDAIDQFCHSFMHFAAPKMDRVSKEDFEKYQYVINGIYVFHDMMLETLIKIGWRRHDCHFTFRSWFLRWRFTPQIHCPNTMQP